MKMEYLSSGSADCPLIRLYDFTPDEVAQLCDVFASLASGEVHTVALHEQPFVQPLHECGLTLRAEKEDTGIVEVDERRFECPLTKSGWEDQKERTQPFAGDGVHGGFLWLLYDIPSEIRLLLSWDGCW
ncbi:MAG TPA: hypothetical protein DD670_09785 [Planctomycetaceae bacterium]|nr:hypothetical protein [Planctomycetaceae bacterium]